MRNGEGYTVVVMEDHQLARNFRAEDVWRILETSVGENKHETAMNMSLEFSRHQSMIPQSQCTVT